MLKEYVFHQNLTLRNREVSRCLCSGIPRPAGARLRFPQPVCMFCDSEAERLNCYKLPETLREIRGSRRFRLH